MGLTDKVGGTGLGVGLGVGVGVGVEVGVSVGVDVGLSVGLGMGVGVSFKDGVSDAFPTGPVDGTVADVDTFAGTSTVAPLEVDCVGRKA